MSRVWLPNNDSPGLAMARAFGDFCLKDYGLISVPDVSYHRLTEKDEFVILATDGVIVYLSIEHLIWLHQFKRVWLVVSVGKILFPGDVFMLFVSVLFDHTILPSSMT